MLNNIVIFDKISYNISKWFKEVDIVQFMEERIIKDGKVFPGNVLKVDSFLNHQIDVELLDKMGQEVKELFQIIRKWTKPNDGTLPVFF